MRLSEMSVKASIRVKKPKTRGAFAPLDAARLQLGLLAVSDDHGQARVSWLIDMSSQTITDARFLAFGELSSHPIADIFTELARGRPVADACRLSAEQIESLLRDDPTTSAFGELGLTPFAFLESIQSKALAELPHLRLLPKPEEKFVYQRKRKLDWSAEDERWFELKLLKKIARIDTVVARVLHERLGHGSYTIEGLHDDFRIVIIFSGLATEQIPTVAQLIQDALHSEIHSHLVVEGKVEEKNS